MLSGVSARRKSYWMKGWKSHVLAWRLSSGFYVALGAAAGGEKSSERNYRWATRAFSSGAETHLLLLWEAREQRQLSCDMEKLFVWWESKKEKRESLLWGFALFSHWWLWCCRSRYVQRAVRKWWEHLDFTWLRIQLSAVLLSCSFFSPTAFSSAWKDLSSINCICPFVDTPSWLLASDEDLGVVMCNGYSFNTPVAPGANRIVCDFHAGTRYNRASNVTRLSARLEVWRYFRVTAAARPVLSGPSRRKQCHMRL